METRDAGERRPSNRAFSRWALVIVAATIVLAIGGPLVGRGTFIGTSVVNTQLPWYLEAPASYWNRLPPVYDTVEIGAPSRIRIRDTLVDDHRVALWDPFVNGGTPLGSQPNTGIFAPINWPLLLLGVQLGTAWAGLLRLAVAAAGMFFLLRRFGLSRFAGACGGLIYCTSGFIVSWNNWPQADIAALIPLLFLTADRLLEHRRPLDLAVLAAVVAAMLLEGYPPLFIATFYALGGYLLVRAWELDHARDPERRSVATRLRDAFRPAWLLLGAVALGAALTAFQLVPFLMRLGLYDTSYRSSNADRGFPAAALLTSVFPWANGNPAQRGTELPIDHVTNFSMAEQFLFLGAAAVVFVIVALLLGPPKRVSSGVYRYCVGVVVLLLLVMLGQAVGPIPNVGRWLRSALYALPGVRQIPLHRFVAPLLFFATLLAAFGIERVVSADRTTPRFGRRPILRAGLVLGFAAFMIGFAIRDEVRLTDWTTKVLHYGVASEVAQRRYILESSVVPALLVLATVLVIVLAWKRHDRVRRVAIYAIPVLLAVEGLLVTTTMFPRVADKDYYPQTGVTRYLSKHLGHERYAPTGTMLLFAANPVYGMRSVGGHSFPAPTWRQLALSTGKGGSAPTQVRLPEMTPELAQSPALDRLAARYLVTPPYTVFGLVAPRPATPRSVVLRSGDTGSTPVEAGPLRAVVLSLRQPQRVRGDLAFVDVTVHDPSGAVLARGSRRLTTRKSADTTYYVAVPGEHIASNVPLTVEVGLRSDKRDTVRLAATARGDFSVRVVKPADDGLRLVYAEPGAIVYRRLHALPRIRWASRAVTIPGARVRRQKLTTGAVDANTVILSGPGPAATGRPATIAVKEDSGDTIRADVNAQGAGYLVVADANQDDWSATVDGRSVKLRDADHALVAVPVPAGRHAVTFSASPRGWRAGIVVSLVALVVLALLCAWGLMRHRRARAGISDTRPTRPIDCKEATNPNR